MIIMLMRFFEKMGVPMGKTRLLINSMGDDNCRPAYRESVRQFIWTTKARCVKSAAVAPTRIHCVRSIAKTRHART